MIAISLAAFVEIPLFLKIACAAQSPETEHCFSRRQPPMSTGNGHAIIDQMSHRSLDDAAGDWKTRCNVLVVAQVIFVIEQVIGAGVESLTLCLF